MGHPDEVGPFWLKPNSRRRQVANSPDLPNPPHSGCSAMAWQEVSRRRRGQRTQFMRPELAALAQAPPRLSPPGGATRRVDIRRLLYDQLAAAPAVLRVPGTTDLLRNFTREHVLSSCAGHGRALTGQTHFADRPGIKTCADAETRQWMVERKLNNQDAINCSNGRSIF